MTKSKKKPSAAQLRARAKFTKIMKSGGFKKKKSTTKKSKSKRFVNKVKPSKTRRNRGGSASDISKESRALLLAIKDPNVKEIIIRKSKPRRKIK